jgi:hypothetical protein
VGALAAAVLAALAMVTATVVWAATPNDPRPGQRIDLKVLLVSADGTEPGFGAWKAELDREGVPYDTFVAYTGAARTATLTGDRLADYAAHHAKYQAVILATGDLVHAVDNPGGTVSYLSALTDAEWAALAKLERTFGVRRLSDFTAPSPLHGLKLVNGIKQDGRTGQLTAAGKAAFPYLKGPVTIPDDRADVDEAFGYEGTPVNAADWQTLVAAPTAGAAYLGIYTHPEDGREEMVMTVAGNQFQTHNQALRHGMLTWVTRGVFLGFQRSYLGIDVDDVFLPDDKWDAVNNVTDYDATIRMDADDVAAALAWQTRTGLRMNMVYNMGGVAEFGQDALFTAFADAKNEFRWINHTYQHPNLDCTTKAYTQRQLTDNQASFDALIGPVAASLNDPSEAVTGEHSGLANVRPGNPGTIDPPGFDELTPTAGTLPAGTYDYAITATSPAGETVASVATTPALPANSGVVATFNAVCHATGFNLYRAPTGTAAWEKVGTLARPDPRAAVDDGTAPLVLSITDGGGPGSAGAPPASNGAALAPYVQNEDYVPALVDAGIHTVASDSSKPYPNPPAKGLPLSESDPTNFPKGASFPLGPTLRAVPRYPSNLYYNVANRADQLDEYNHIYLAPPAGICQASAVNTCRTTPATWAEYLDSETRIMFGHLMGNDPRPHYFHQTNIAEADLTKPATDVTIGGTLYAAMDTLLARYDTVFDRAVAPLVQVSQAQAAEILVRQDAWAATRASGAVTAWLQDGAIHVANGGTAAAEVPVTGTTAGAEYGRQRSGWITLAAGAEQVLQAADPAQAAAPAVSGAAKVGRRLTATGGTWTGTPEIARRLRWQRCDAKGCTDVAGATGATYDVTGADVGSSLRVVVTAGNWISAVGLAVSERTAAVAKPPAAPAGGKPGTKPGGSGTGPTGSGGPRKARRRLVLTRVRMHPRRFAVAHRRPRAGTRPDGAAITWRLTRRATVRLTFHKARGKGASRRWVKVGSIRRRAASGPGIVRFRGRFGARPLAPGRYRVVVRAEHGGQRSGPARMRFRVVRR